MENMTLNVFISQPMNGLSDATIREQREQVKKELENHFKGKSIKIIDSLIEDFDPENTPRLEYLSRSIGYLAKADIAVFVNDWANYRGCTIEHICCEEYLIPVIHLSI